MSLPITQPNQWIRKITLLVSTGLGEALDLSLLRIKFAVKRSDAQTPNSADIRVYNLDLKLAGLIKKEFTKIILQAGYQSNFGVIFQGNIKQVILGRENNTDTYIDIVAGDGDQAYNFAIVNTTLAAGSTKLSQLAAATAPMAPMGVTPGYMGVLPVQPLPRAKVMFGTARDHIRNLADSSGFRWSIQDEQIQFIKQTTYLPGIAVELSAKTGLIGTPQQTNEGVNCKCLLNPKLKIGGLIKIDNSIVELTKINLAVPGTSKNAPVDLNSNGIYYVLVAENTGDTRGQDWYTNLVLVNVDPTLPPLNSVTIGAGT